MTTTLAARELDAIRNNRTESADVLVGRVDSCERVENGLGNARGVFDTGPSYGAGEAERRLGEALLRLPPYDPIIATKVGVQSYGAALTPDAKMAAIRRLSAEGRVVAMVGDGVNDAPGLAAADVAIGMGGRGSDAALESSDVVLADDRIERLVDAIELSRAARRAIRVNILISIGAALGMAAYVVFRPGVPLSLGVGVHEGSTVLVCLNGLRLLAHRPRRTA
jgi:hypothetical protein